VRALRRGDVIPIQLDPGATSDTVELAPDAASSAGTPLTMKAQLVYHDGADQPVYGPVFTSGQSTIDLLNGAMDLSAHQLWSDYVARYRAMAIATADRAGNVSCATVFYAIDHAGRLYFGCSGATLKARHLIENPRIGVAISDGGATLAGVQIRGLAVLLTGAAEVDDARRCLAARHPEVGAFYSEADLLFFRVEPEERFLLNFSWGIDSRLRVPSRAPDEIPPPPPSESD